jgi:hypothetical protein
LCPIVRAGQDNLRMGVEAAHFSKDIRTRHARQG